MATRVVVVVVGLFNLGIGFWALLDPQSFFARLAVFPPYNQHFIHDVGAFQLGLGMALFLALAWSDALLVSLTAGGIAATVHVISHVIDRDLGGNPQTDIPLLSLLALALLVAAGLRLRQLRA
ncbi:MAG: hypothetical protein WAT58_05925 [Candidatus Dormiibacterota bacterium]